MIDIEEISVKYFYSFFFFFKFDKRVEDQSFFEIVKLEMLLMKILTFNNNNI